MSKRAVRKPCAGSRWTMDQIRRVNRDMGFFWFSPDTMRFFSSRVGDRVDQGPAGIFFVSSEQFDYKSPRFYTIRQFDPDAGSIDDVGGFQAYDTNRTAHREAVKLAQMGA